MAATVLKDQTEFNKPEQLGFSDDTSETGKFKFLLGLLKKLVGVSDIINLRLSLPSQVLDPIPNLEHFHWVDRPDYFASMGGSSDPVERMLSVLRYCFSKDVTKAKERLKKPYNSILGEHFACSWEVPLVGDDEASKKVKVTMLNEQTSHHPPVSAFWYECKETGVVASGCDHLSAKFTGTAIKVIPGDMGQGIYITLKNHNNEEYHITHCNASIQGWLTGSLYLALQDRVVISCPQTKLRVVYDYKPERWVGKSKFAVEGKMFSYTPTFTTHPDTHSDLPQDSFKLTDIPDSDTLMHISGSWRDKVYITRSTKSSTDKELLIDISSLTAIPKIVKPIDSMDPLESRKVWQEVTDNIVSKNFGAATKAKVAIEDAQRAKAKARAELNKATTPTAHCDQAVGSVQAGWEPKYFKVLPKGQDHRPQLLEGAEPKY